MTTDRDQPPSGIPDGHDPKRRRSTAPDPASRSSADRAVERPAEATTPKSAETPPKRAKPGSAEGSAAAGAPSSRAPSTPRSDGIAAERPASAKPPLTRPIPATAAKEAKVGRAGIAATLARVARRAKLEAPAPDPRFAALESDEEIEESWTEQVRREAFRTLPAFLGSLLVHLGLLVVLALVVFRTWESEVMRLDVGFSAPTPEIDDFEMDGFENDSADVPPLYDPEALVIEPPVYELPPLTVRPDAPMIVDPLEAITGSTALSGREVGSKEQLLAEMGGTQGTEDTVKAGLDWLARNQQRDGTWSMQGPFSDGTGLENRSAATGLALLCFLGAGHTHTSGEHQDRVRRGLDALLARQQFDGDFYRRDGDQSEIPNHHLYSHAIGMIVVCELLAMTGDERLREPAIKAVAFSEKYQSPEGGWRYSLGVDADLSVTGWFVIGLQSARMAGIDVKPETWAGIERMLYRVASEDGIRYSYKKNEEPTLSMTAEGVLCRQYLGWKKAEPQMADSVAYLTAHPIDFAAKDYYYWYYATQVMHNVEGEAWATWNQVMREAIPANQTRTGRERGSWEPEGDRYAMSGGGRLYGTTLMILTLESYYRHLPLYRYRTE